MTGTRPSSLVHESALAEVWLGDAVDVLAERPTESINLVVTDPPYGVEWQSGWRTEQFTPLVGDESSTDGRQTINQALAECVRLVGQNRHLYVFGPSDVLAGLKVSDTAELIWDKDRPGMGNLAAPWGPQHEPITFAVSAFRHAGKTGGPKLAVRLRKGSVLKFSPPTGRKVRHPTEKPISLLRELIESSSRQGEVVLDPFAGSGATGVAAILSGRRCVLVERDPQWMPMILARIEAAERNAKEGSTI